MVESPVDAGLSTFFGPVDLVGCKPPTQNRPGEDRHDSGVEGHELPGRLLVRDEGRAAVPLLVGVLQRRDADAGPRIATRQAFEVMFPAWLKSKRSITEGSGEDRRARR
jgi:hypothetical protein